MRSKNYKKKVLFICKHNSCRSQMAEGLLKSIKGKHYQVYSAGSDPTTINSYAVKVMMELGIDISTQHAKSLLDFKRNEFNYVITLCNSADEACPVFRGGEIYIHQAFQDPSSIDGNEDEKLRHFRKVRDEIRVWIEKTFNGDSKCLK